MSSSSTKGSEEVQTAEQAALLTAPPAYLGSTESTSHPHLVSWH